MYMHVCAHVHVHMCESQRWGGKEGDRKNHHASMHVIKLCENGLETASQ